MRDGYSGLVASLAANAHRTAQVALRANRLMHATWSATESRGRQREGWFQRHAAKLDDRQVLAAIDVAHREFEGIARNVPQYERQLSRGMSVL